MSEQLAYHVHAHLTILVDAEKVPVPALIGINQVDDCLYWLHTHDTSGIIHIEGPDGLVFHLGQFFAIWGQPITRHQVATTTVDADHSVRAFVGLKLYTGKLANIPLLRHTSITLEVGPPFKKPKLFNFRGY